MREIRFRAWDSQFKRMKVTGMGLNQGVLDGEDVEIMQYTGLKDKNGREIYEGDILEWPKSILSSGQIGEVKFVCDGFGNGYFCVNDYIKWNLNTDKCPAEIVGNIFENKELLK